MEKLYKVPLAFLLIASCIGLVLRHQLITPTEGLNYSYVLHAHSHVMFSGWVFNILILAFSTEFVRIKNFRTLFWALQLCVAGMLISFLLQGYGAASITFSSLHTIGAFVFIALFLLSSRSMPSIALMLVRASLLFFALSSFGPFSLAYLKAAGLAHSNLYRFSIYFYLHFQYNGFFFFGILALFLKLLEDKVPVSGLRKAGTGCWILILCCLPTYFLSILWAQPAAWFNLIGLAAALAQCAGLYLFLQPALPPFTKLRLSSQEKLLFSLSLASLILKSMLQVVSAIPAAAVFANDFRAVLVAYVHLVLLGFISFFLIGWLLQRKIIQLQRSWPVNIIAGGFVASEITLITTPWHDTFVLSIMNLNTLIFSFSVLMVVGIAALLLPGQIKQ